MQPGDVVVVTTRADLTSGVFGAMMMTYFRGRGGLGVVIDGAVRDFAEIKSLGLGLWLRGVTPNFHTQTNIFPFAVNVPIACGGVTVVPGDIIIADDDGAVVVPVALAPNLAKRATEHVEWEEFSRVRLSEGGDLRRYYPLSDAARPEYDAWRRAQRDGGAHSRSGRPPRPARRLRYGVMTSATIRERHGGRRPRPQLHESDMVVVLAVRIPARLTWITLV
jgi:hypothetical protein